MEDKKRIFSGVQPSGHLTIGNYLGAIKTGLSCRMTTTLSTVLWIFMH